VKEKAVMPLVSRQLATNILKGGYSYEFPESRLRRREMRGLPPLPKPNLVDLKKIFEITGSLEMLEKAKTFEKVKS